MKDKLEELRFYNLTMDLWNQCWEDTEILVKDIRGKEFARQLIRAVGSISANIEEGYGRGFGKEYPRFLKISRGSAREAKGWYVRSDKLLNRNIINERINIIEAIIGMLTKTIQTLEQKRNRHTLN